MADCMCACFPWMNTIEAPIKAREYVRDDNFGGRKGIRWLPHLVLAASQGCRRCLHHRLRNNSGFRPLVEVNRYVHGCLRGPSVSCNHCDTCICTTVRISEAKAAEICVFLLSLEIFSCRNISRTNNTELSCPDDRAQLKNCDFETALDLRRTWDITQFTGNTALAASIHLCVYVSTFSVYTCIPS